MKRTLLAFVLTVGSASASQIACAPDTLDNFLGNYAICGTITYDFTTGFYSPGGGASLAASDIIVTPSFDNINFSVTAGGGGAFATTGAGNGYSTFEIGYTASINPLYYFAGIKMRANNVHFDNNNGGSDDADALKIVTFGSNPDDGGNPYAYSVDAASGFVDTSSGSGDVNFAQISDAILFLPTNTTTWMTVDDTITLDPSGTPGESIQSVDNFLQTPEPVTYLSLGMALAALGLFRRRKGTERTMPIMRK